MPNASFDTILAMDTIEHLGDPSAWFRAALRRLGRGGRIIATWQFHDCGGTHPMHLRDPRRVGAFLRAVEETCDDAVSDGLYVLTLRSWSLYP